ncbi:MAG: hypothetical protein KBB83_06770 [Alphaproteobacteria bacterium]|nr:hypothetical protein [Alphaproteobacteria bacterium]
MNKRIIITTVSSVGLTYIVSAILGFFNLAIRKIGEPWDFNSGSLLAQTLIIIMMFVPPLSAIFVVHVYDRLTGKGDNQWTGRGR